jgi:gamma-glutamylcysteine synthetase
MSRTRKSLIAVFTFALIAALAHEVYAQVRLNQLMIDKLQNSQKLLEAIALGKFDKIEKHANELVRISKTAEWLAQKRPRYEQFSNEFQQAAEEIARKAKAKNMDGVTLAYFDLTKSCVRCHQHMREVRDARLPGEREDALTAIIGNKQHGEPSSVASGVMR